MLCHGARRDGRGGVNGGGGGQGGGSDGNTASGEAPCSCMSDVCHDGEDGRSVMVTGPARPWTGAANRALPVRGCVSVKPDSGAETEAGSGVKSQAQARVAAADASGWRIKAEDYVIDGSGHERGGGAASVARTGAKAEAEKSGDRYPSRGGGLEADDARQACALRPAATAGGQGQWCGTLGVSDEDETMGWGGVPKSGRKGPGKAAWRGSLERPKGEAAKRDRKERPKGEALVWSCLDACLMAPRSFLPASVRPWACVCLWAWI